LYIITYNNENNPVNYSLKDRRNFATSISTDELQTIHFVTGAEFTDAVVDWFPAENGVGF